MNIPVNFIMPIIEIICIVGGFAITIYVNITKNNTKMDGLKTFFDLQFTHVKDDLSRLERKQDESNRTKERLAVLESAFKICQGQKGKIDCG